MERIDHLCERENLDELLLGCPRDSAGMYDVEQDRLERLEAWLESMSLLRKEPDADEVAAGVRRARQLEADGMLGASLLAMEFMPEHRCKRLIGDTEPINLWFDRPLYAEPTQVLGAVSFGSWMGRGYMGQGEVARRESRGTRASFEQITDYATREGQLPYLSADGGLNLILGNDQEPFLYASNAHRAAAAKLRNEPLGFRRLSIYRVGK